MLNISLIVCNTSFKTPIEGKIKPYIKRSKTIPIYHIMIQVTVIGKKNGKEYNLSFDMQT